MKFTKVIKMPSYCNTSVGSEVLRQIVK